MFRVVIFLQKLVPLFLLNNVEYSKCSWYSFTSNWCPLLAQISDRHLNFRNRLCFFTNKISKFPEITLIYTSTTRHSSRLNFCQLTEHAFFGWSTWLPTSVIRQPNDSCLLCLIVENKIMQWGKSRFSVALIYPSRNLFGKCWRK